jgi:hypothetical protein
LETATGWLITQGSRIRILSSLPAETRPEGFAPGGCHAAREHRSTCQLSALPHGASARTVVCMFGSLKPSDRSSGLRSFGLSEACRPQRNPVRFTFYAATTRMRRSRSNVLHSAHESACAAGQRHSLPPHTRKVTGSIPVGGHRRRPETVESGGETRRDGSDGRLILSCERIRRGDWRRRSLGS